MTDLSLFTWRHFEADILLCVVRWYLRYVLSYRDVEELLRERGVWIDHTTVFRWVQRDAPALDKPCRSSLRATDDSYRVDETSITINKPWYDLYRAVDSTGATLDFMRKRCNRLAAEFLLKAFSKRRLQGKTRLRARLTTVSRHDQPVEESQTGTLAN